MMILAQTTQTSGVNEFVTAWGGVFQALAAVIIGYATYRILTRQSLDAEHKTKLELYRMRYNVYSILYDYLIKAVNDEQPVSYEAYVGAIKESRFLFKKDVAIFVDAMHERLMEMLGIYEKIPEIGYDAGYYERPEIKSQLDRAELLKKELKEIAVGMGAMFLPYLNFRNIGLRRRSTLTRIARAIKKKMDEPDMKR